MVLLTEVRLFLGVPHGFQTTGVCDEVSAGVAMHPAGVASPSTSLQRE